MKGYVAVQKKLLLVMYTLWKKDQPYRNDYEEKIISGNDGHKLLFPFEGQKNSAAKAALHKMNFGTTNRMKSSFR